jgi:hypothetical protein
MALSPVTGSRSTQLFTHEHEMISPIRASGSTV